MLQLTVTAKLSDVVLQDPFPSDGMWSLSVLAGHTKVVTISWDQFQRIANQIALLEQAGFCTVTIEAITNGEVRGQENDLVGMPAIDWVYITGGGAGSAIPALGTADLYIVGDQLLAQQGIAHLIVGDPLTPDARIEFLSPTPGVQGNDLQVEITDDGIPGLMTITVVGTRVSIELHASAPTAGAVAAAVNTAVTGARGTVFAIAQGTGLGVVLPSPLANLGRGFGAGMNVTFGGQPCVVVQSFAGALPTDPQTVVVDTPDLVASIGAAAGEAAVLYLRSGSKKTASTHALS
jgi:hypothetical protein